MPVVSISLCYVSKAHLAVKNILSSVMVLGFPEYKRIEICSRSLCKDAMGNLVLRLKKCTELNRGHLEQMLYYSAQE